MTPELPEALQVLFRITEVFENLHINYHIGGSYASSIHGIPRQTQDIDIVADMSLELVEDLASEIQDEFYVDRDMIKQAINERISFNLVHLSSGIKIDIFICGDQEFDKEEFSRHQRQALDMMSEHFVYVKTAEDILLRKLQWYRLGGEVSDRQWNDILGIIRTQSTLLDRQYLVRWAKTLGVNDLLEQALNGLF